MKHAPVSLEKDGHKTIRIGTMTVAADKPARPVPIPAPRAAMIYQSNSMKLSPCVCSLASVFLRLISMMLCVSPEPYYTTLFSSAHAILSSCANGCVIASQHN